MPSKNDHPSKQVDRRTRKREARREALLAVAADLAASEGIDGLTMAALGEATDYATASLYTYFPSRSALVVALQIRALHRLRAVADVAVARWDDTLGVAASGMSPDAALARLWAWADLFLTAPQHHGPEFALQQELLHTSLSDPTEAVDAVPVVMALLAVPQRLLHDAERAGALTPAPDRSDPLGQLVSGPMVRMLTWTTAMNGALAVDQLFTGVPLAGRALGEQLTTDLLVGWGADPTMSIRARERTRTWIEGDLAAEPGGPGRPSSTSTAEVDDGTRAPRGARGAGGAG